MFSLREGQGATSISEDVQRHDPRGTVHAPLALMSSAEHQVALWEGRIMVYGHRDAGAVQSSLRGLKCIMQNGEWKMGLESFIACYSNSSHCSINLVISVFLSA